jgi:recombination directionality factor gp3-like protein
MSPILDLQQRLQEVGRIRMGQQVPTKGGKRRPAKLDHWRLTSRDEQRLAAVAELYGGTVQPWVGRDGEYEVYTGSDELRVLIIPGQALSQWWEMWSGGGCLRRCDGHHELLSDGPCLCPAAYDERAEASAANPPKACKPTTRLAVLLPDVPGIGHWRLETHSYYAAVELAAAAGLLEEATRRGALLPARLRIDVRRKVAGGQTTVYPVPVVDLDVTTQALLQLQDGGGVVQGEVLALPAPVDGAQGASTPPPVPVAEQSAGRSLDEGLAAVAAPPPPAAPRANAQEPMGAVAPPPPPTKTGPAAADPPDAAAGASTTGQDTLPGAAAPLTPPAVPLPPTETPMANQRQRRLLWATVREREMGDAQLRHILAKHTKQESTAAIPADKFEKVLDDVKAAKVLPAEAAQ